MQVDDDAAIVQPTALTHGPNATPQRIVGFEPLVGQDDVGDDGEEDVQVVRLLGVVDEQPHIFVGGIAHRSRLGHHRLQLVQ